MCRLLPTSCGHPYRHGGPQCDAGLHRDRYSLARLELPALRERCEHEDRFHPRERLADAHAGTGTEWKVREFRPRTLTFWQPAIGIEALGLDEESRIVVKQILRD